MEIEQGVGDSDGVHVRLMRPDEIDLAVVWAKAEGWNPGHHDAACFYATDPEGFFIAEVDGKPVGSASMVVYDGTFCFGGFFMVLPEYRRKGYGKALRLAAMERAGTRIVGLDGVVAQQDNYRQMGFVFACNNIRYEALGTPAALAADIVPLRSIPFDDLAAFDARFFPAPRATFLKKWIAMPESFGYAAGCDGALAGYGVIRPCARGFKIGPLFAVDPDIAEHLYCALAAQAPGAPVYLDVPQTNPHAVALAEAHGMKEVFSTARMYMNGSPNMELDGIYGVTTFELG